MYGRATLDYAARPMARWLLDRSQLICRAIAYLAALLVAAPLVYHVSRGSLAYLGLFEDDYFFYAIIADNLATLGRLTYDHSTLTNGFHPLWLVVLFVVRLVAGGMNGVFYVILAALFVGSMVATYELSRAFARALGASASLAPAAALAYAVPADILSCSGMETAVGIPFFLWLLVEVAKTESVTPRRAARLGLIASLAVLARIDIGLFVVLLAAAWLAFARPRLSTALRAALAFSGAGFMVGVYLILNVVVFGSPFPISGLAKQLVVKKVGFNIRYLWGVAFHTAFGPAAGITLAAGAWVVYVLWRRGVTPDAKGARNPPPAALLTGAVVLCFTGVFFFLNALSGWIYFGWYGYPLVPALVAALTLIGVWAVPRVAPPVRERVAAVVVAGCAALATGQGLRYFVTRGPLWTVQDNGILATALELADRMRERKGVFAMGSAGALAAYVMHEPFVQLEALVSDRAMLEHIRHEDDLGAVLREYNVDYLVVSLYAAKMEKHDGCYVITQPHAEWAGKRVAKMHGDICEEPIVTLAIRSPERPWSVFSKLDTFVFDLRNAKWRAEGPQQRTNGS
jgi:hypothetical protein